MSKFAIVRIRGDVKLKTDVRTTFRFLNLNKKHSCVVIEDSPSLRGMLRQVKDYVTWGEVSDDTYKELFSKRGREFKGRLVDKKEKIKYDNFITFNKKKYEKCIPLAPPKGGFRGIKKAYNQGGTLGYRGDKINELIARMI